ncbi:MAG: hypothetical protein CCU26_18520, partial [Nitrospira sp. UW-LDO-01]
MIIAIITKQPIDPDSTPKHVRLTAALQFVVPTVPIQHIMPLIPQQDIRISPTKEAVSYTHL